VLRPEVLDHRPREQYVSATHGDVTRGPADPPRRQHQLRTDIQGLRAIAVLVVIVAHAGIGPFHGGFVGVDVFFVISGFLISQLLYREVERHGRVSIAGFYARRARRILPAATLVTVATLVAAMLFMSLVDATTVITDALWATFFAANIRFAATGVDYFAQDQAASPLQHYWSLSVEEQFYLVWPLLLVGCVAWTARRRRTGRRTSATGRRQADPPALPGGTVAWALLGVTALSFAWSVWTTATSPETAYFSTLARAWELGIGALAALIGPALVRPLTARARMLLSALGLAAILVASLSYTEATPFPGYAAALPVLGSAAVLVAGIGLTADRPAPLPMRALGVRPMRVVGDWSYSLYLWHWPILVVLEAHLGRAPGPYSTTAALLLTFALAALTYRFVEQPFRSPVTFTVPRALVLYPLSLAVVAASAAGGWYYTTWAGGELGDNPAITLSRFGADDPVRVALAEDPAVALVQASVLAARNGMGVPSDLSPDLLELRDDVADVGECDYTDDEVRSLCVGGDTDAERSIVVLGDSHGRAWIPTFEEIAEQAGYRTYYLVKVQCTAADVAVAKLRSGDPWPACTQFHEWAQEQLEEIEPELVVVSTSAPINGVYVDGERVTSADEVAAEMRAGYARLFADVAPTTDRLVLLKDVPKAPNDPATCLTRGTPSLKRCMFAPVKHSLRLADVSVEAAEEAGVEVVDPKRWFCWDGSCPVVVGDTVTYRDPGHITATYARELAGPLGEALGLTGTDRASAPAG
jgi:peptidoglycan/LPS O-acetylase OafA/YrhL